MDTPRGPWHGAGPPPAEMFLPASFPEGLPAPAAALEEAGRAAAAAYRAAAESPPAGFRPLAEQAAPPSLATRAGYLASALVAAVASGGERVTPEERDRRLTICASCEHFDASAEKCRRCTCHMPLKTRLAAWHCPLPDPKW